MNLLSNTSVKQPRKALISSIQCESKKLKQLEAENLELKTTLKDYELVMKLMSQKYRNHITKLISHLNVENEIKSNNATNLKYKLKIEEQAQKIDTLVSFINKIMNLDIENFLDIQKSLTRLQLENEGLRQMLKISNENNNLKPIPETTEIGTQISPESLTNDCSELSNMLSNCKQTDLNVSNDFTNELNSTKKLNEINDEISDEHDTATIKKTVKEFKEGHSKSDSKPTGLRINGGLVL